MTTPSVASRLERRQQVWPIGLWVIMLATVAAAGLLLALFYRNQGLRQAARATVHRELITHHWKNLEVMAEFRPFIDILDRLLETGADSGELRWRAKFISITPKPGSLDPFETQALERIRAGKDEVWQQSWLSTTRYVLGVRAVQACIVCHQTGPGRTPTKPNDLIGVVSLELAPGRPEPVQVVATPTTGGT